MIRVCSVVIEGYDEPFKIKSLTCSEADEFVKKTKEMIARKDSLGDGAWLDRTLEVVSANLLIADAAWSSERLKAELDLSTLNVLYLKILDFSGLRTGEVKAA